jgi:hypothetical protein
MLGDRQDEWLAARLEDLDHGYIDGIEAIGRGYPAVPLARHSHPTATGRVLLKKLCRTLAN